MSIYEMNCANVKQDIDTMRIKKNSPVVEVFSALVQGKKPDVDGKVLDKSIAFIKDLADKALVQDPAAVSEINTIIRYAIEPKLLERIKLFDFMGTYHTIGYHEAPMMKTYRYESVDSRFQASSSDVPFASYSFSEYPIPTQTISSGFSVDYREIQSGNFDGSVAEGISQVQTDMQNKAVYYVISKLYNGIKNAQGITHFIESEGITQSAVDQMLNDMHYYGKISICGDYAVVSQFNDFVGYKTVGSETIPYGADVVADEIRKTGLISWYKGSFVTELPNSYNWTRLNADGTNYLPYMPQGLLFFIPKGNVSPLQIFQRGGMTSMTADDIVTRQHMTRFDMEIGADVARGMEDQIGLISDTNYTVPGV